MVDYRYNQTHWKEIGTRNFTQDFIDAKQSIS